MIAQFFKRSDQWEVRYDMLFDHGHMPRVWFPLRIDALLNDLPSEWYAQSLWLSSVCAEWHSAVAPWA